MPLCEQTTPPSVQVRGQRGGQGIAGMYALSKMSLHAGTQSEVPRRAEAEGAFSKSMAGRWKDAPGKRAQSRREGHCREGSPHLGRGLALSVAVVSHGPEDLMSARGGALESYVKKSTGAGKEDLVQSSLEERVFTCPPPAVEGPRGFRDRALASCCSAWRAPGHRKGRRGVEA